MSSVHSFSRLRTSGSGAPGDVGEVVPGAEHRPLAGEHDARRVAAARPRCTAASSWVRCSRDSAFRLAGRVIVMRTTSPSRSTLGAPSVMADASQVRPAPAPSRPRPFASRITSTTEPMISVSPKSFGVKTWATPCSRSRRASLSGMIPPTTTGTSSRPASFRPSQHRRHHLQVRARQHRQPDDVHVLLDRGGDDLRRGQPDALVDRPRSRRRGRGRRSARRRWSARRGRACRPGSAAGRRAPRRWPAPARGCR